MRLHLPERGERGAIAIMTAFLAVALMAVAALGVDITSQVNQRQKLHDTIDAAALAGAYRLPSNGAQAKLDAVTFAANNDPGAPAPAVDLFCVVASKASGSTWVVDTTQIPATCNPASVGSPYSSARCNARICAIPCNGASDVCNVIRVVGAKPVPFAFAPVIGINQGSTGSVTSVACKGSCGTTPPNPMDVAVVADRTGSMSSTDINAMITGIKGMFTFMTPSQQYVALGTIGRSAQTPYSTTCGSGSYKALSQPSTSDTAGPWVPVPFSSDYLTGTTTNPSSTLVNAVECIKNSSGTGTHLASAMKYAARYLLGIDPNNIGSVPPQSGTVPLPTQPGTIRKAIIFETDGAPNESLNTSSTLTGLNSPGDIENTNKDNACTNLKTVANNAKNAGILVVTVAFNMSPTDMCGGSLRIDQTLAAAASPTSSGVASAADFDCSTTAGRNSENGDNDMFFCAGSGSDMASIFRTALGQLGGGTRLIKLP